MDTPEDIEFLKQLQKTDPDFFQAYTQGDQQVPAEKIMFVRECAEDMGVCENTITNHIKSGKLIAKSVDGRWVIKESDFLAYKASATVVYGKNNRAIITFAEQKPKKRDQKARTQMNSKYIYEKATSRTVTDFLHNWHRNKSDGFSLLTICRDFNAVSAIPANENQMSGILSSLKKKGIVIRKGKGIYQVSPSIASEAPAPTPEIPEAPKPAVEDGRDHNRVYVKKQERIAIETFISENFDPSRDLIFTVKDLSRRFPHLDRKKLGKACVNMSHTGRLEKAVGMGQYMKRATAPKAKTIDTPVVTSSESENMTNLKKIMNSNLDESLKLELIRKFLG